jgi:hypothetical protein
MVRFTSLKVAGIGTMLVLLSGCASSFSSGLEDARFELDQGNYAAAISAAGDALAAQPGNVEATRILASAYFGRSGLDFLDLASGTIDLNNSSDPNFAQIADALPNPNTTTVDLDDVRSAIVALEGLTGIDDALITDEGLADAAFDLALMQSIEHFVLGVYRSDYYDGNDNTVVDVTGVTDADRAIVQADLVAFDNRLIGSGVEATESFIGEIRQTFCILEPISAGEGFTLAEFQALVACELSTDSAAVDTTIFTADIANCAVLDPNDADPCLDTDTSL